MNMRGRDAVSSFLVGLGLCMTVGSRCLAQAWLPPAGELTFATSFQRVEGKGHFLDDGSRLPGYRTRASNMQFELSYGISDRLAVDLSLPYVKVKYLGPEEPLNLPTNKLDDGANHGAFADVTAQVRIRAIDGPVTLTPFFAASVPSHDYPTIGEASAGAGFPVLQVGLSGGRLFDVVLPCFVQGTYSYAFVRQDVGVPLDHSNVELSAGVVVAEGLQVSLLWRKQWAHGGMTFDELYAAPPGIFLNMDRLTRQSFQHVGVAAGYQLTESMSVHANYVSFNSGVDAHFGHSFSAGLSWSRQLLRQEDPFAERRK